VLLVVPVGAVVLHPRVLNALVGRALRVIKRAPLQERLSGRAIAVTMAAYVAAWLCLGLQTWVLVRDLGADAVGALVPSVLGYALAASLGMVAVLLPAGIGLREVVLVLLLTGPLDRPAAAAAVVLLSRFVVTASDVVAAALAWLYDRSHHFLAR
jgi:uncharacterized membrane protein YbhN (UPF0104 family)